MKLKELPLDKLKEEYNTGGTLREIAKKYGVGTTTIHRRLNGQTSMKPQIRHFKQLQHLIGNNLDKGWVVGFVDGEANFSIIVHKKRGYVSGKKVFPTFNIAQNKKDILLEIKKFFGIGSVSKKGKDGVYSYRVNGYTSCEFIKRFFEENPLRVKQRDFEVWKSIIDVVIEKKYLLAKEDIEWIEKTRFKRR
ncbi:MAG: hypothetical protein KKE96_03110 [Candidatus Altiarchaeota archaeon]|nr:hypothetical protein [Candidatus Altiarchaeota archaeon]MBU4266196.1 hypothetical protein [Candidatus Altiarchaeota archaeon]MBU4341796.1 hypothetical protein [Candidatus Altiarchaeota archaeon]MBU4437392.1 hypothetical protein [Candidatus Altiarchaeota archaeon]